MSLTRSQAAVENTTFGSNSRTFLPGIKEASYSYQGFFDSDGTSAIDDLYTASFDATVAEVLTIVLPDGTTDSATYSFQAIHSSYSPWGGAIGDMAAFQIDGSGVGDSFKGKLLEAGQTARSSSYSSRIPVVRRSSSGSIPRPRV